MATPVIMPRFGNSVESCLIVQWFKNAGDSIAEGEALCEIETDKSTIEVEAPVAGTVLDIFFPADEDVDVMTNIAAIGDAGEDVSSLRPDGAGAAAPVEEVQEEAEAQPATTVIILEDENDNTALTPVANNAGDSLASPRARGLAAKNNIDFSTLTGSGPQGRVIERDVQAAIDAGPRLSPAAAELVSKELVAPQRGSGPGGLVLAGDLIPAGSGVAPAPAVAPAVGETRTIKVKGIRKIIAERMVQSLSSTAQLTMNATAKATNLQVYRAQIKAGAESAGLPNITIGDMIVFAVSRVLPRHPAMNAHFLGDRIVEYDDCNIGVAVDTERGLMVPVIPQAQRLSLAALAATFKPLATSCQEGSIDPVHLQGGTFTVTNLGALGVEHFTPVLNAPEVGILGIGGLSLKPYPGKDGEVEFIPSIALSLTIDHQALDGAPAARFLKDLVNTIENFQLALAN